MSKPITSYEFAGLRLFPLSQQLEILSCGSKINLSPTHFRFLLTLVLSRRQTVSYEEFRLAVWNQSKELDDSLKRLIQTTKGDLIKTLRQAGIQPDFIETISGRGYRLNANVSTPDEVVNSDFPTENSTLFKSQIKIRESVPKRYLTFISVVSFFYGFLFWAALLLESAYRIEDFKAKIFWLTVPLILWNGATMLAAFIITRQFLQKGRRNVLLAGISLLIFGAAVTSLIILFVLPSEPITAARFQTQPALSAYLKNVWIYFLPLGVFFILFPFYAVCGRQNDRKVFTIPPSVLLSLWFLALIYSIISTFYLLDNLLPSEHHSLFVNSIFLRFFVYFALGIAVLLWYFFNNEESLDEKTITSNFSEQTAINLL